MIGSGRDRLDFATHLLQNRDGGALVNVSL
jgi:hypothetical protein